MRNANKKLLNASDLGNLSADQLMKIKRDLDIKVARGQAGNAQRQINLANLVTARQNSASKFKKEFFQGSVQEINTVFFPFLFQSDTVLVEAGEEVNSKITITAEAAFVARTISATVFEYQDLGGGNFNLSYVDLTSSTSAVEDLRFQINDLSSERTLTDKPISLSALGGAGCYTILDDPFYINPNQSIEFRFSAEGNKSYFASIMLGGYRIRIQDASRLNIPTVTL
jgi:hypothetical protein